MKLASLGIPESTIAEWLTIECHRDSLKTANVMGALKGIPKLFGKLPTPARVGLGVGAPLAAAAGANNFFSTKVDPEKSLTEFKGFDNFNRGNGNVPMMNMPARLDLLRNQLQKASNPVDRIKLQQQLGQLASQRNTAAQAIQGVMQDSNFRKFTDTVSNVDPSTLSARPELSWYQRLNPTNWSMFRKKDPTMWLDDYNEAAKQYGDLSKRYFGLKEMYGV